jgi:hypothetical protein
MCQVRDDALLEADFQGDVADEHLERVAVEP